MQREIKDIQMTVRVNQLKKERKKERKKEKKNTAS